MGRYDSHKHPFQYRMNQWSQKRTNTAQERQTKSIPCHVTKVDKDFITVAFETQNGIFTPPTVKIPQSMSQYGRDPTQVGDKGFASPSDYYLGGVTGDAGGNTNFYPRGNLTAISFQPVSHKQNPDRDVDQLTHMGGPNGWIVGSFKKQKQDGQTGQDGGSTGTGNVGTASVAAMFRPQTSSFRAQQERLRKAVPRDILGGILPGGGGSGGGGLGGLTGGAGGLGGQQQQQEDDDVTQFSFDKDKKALVQSKDKDHNLLVDGKNQNVGLTSKKSIFHNPNDGKVYLGGKDGSGMFRVMTEKGPSKNTFAKVG
jgi:hypothetical protein